MLPGLINAHVHTLEQLERGIADHLPIFPWVFEKTLPYEAVLTPEEIYFASLLCCAELIKTGTTTIAEVGAHPQHAYIAEKNSPSEVNLHNAGHLDNGIYAALESTT